MKDTDLFSFCSNALDEQEQREKEEFKKSVVEDYFDYNANVEERFLEWKKNAKRTCTFHICHEIYNKSEKHIAEMILVVFKGEKLEKKLTALRQLGHTAKYVKCF